MVRYRYASEWLVAAPEERVWDALLLVTEWPRWWRGFLAVERLEDGQASGIGMRLRQRWRGPLPWTTTMELEIADVASRRVLAGRATGDMRGSATWTFEDRGGRTAVRFDLDVSPTRWWMRLPVPFAGRFFAWNVGTIVRWGADGLSRLLDVPVEHRSVR